MTSPRRSLDRWRGFTLIELLVVIGIIAVLVALILPAVNAAREAARRAQCVNNLKQLALASANYEHIWGSYPIGVQFTFNISTCSHWLTQLPFFEQQPLFDTYNFDWNILSAANTTTSGVKLSVFLCPSDALIQRPVDFDQSLYGLDSDHFYQGTVEYELCSYKASGGTWFRQSRDPGRQREANGVFLRQQTVGPAEITDGLSNTVLYGEASVRILNDEEVYYEGPWWSSGWFAGTVFTSLYPLNPQRNGVIDDWAADGLSHVYSVAASSDHPGGANVVMVDGSVHFIKENIDSWQISKVTGLPNGVTRDPQTGTYTVGPQAHVGVWQKITTREWGDLVGTGDY